MHREPREQLSSGAFLRQGCRKAFKAQKERLEAFLGNSFGEAHKTEACLVSSPRRMKDFCLGGNGVFLLGEAAGFISASSFEGLSSAMFSGKALADALSASARPESALRIYRKRTFGLRLRLRLKSVKRVLLCNPLVREIIMRSEIQCIRPYSQR